MGVGFGMWRDPEQKLNTAKLCLPKLLRWWPQICLFDQRFSHGTFFGDSQVARGWPNWAAGLCNLCMDLGVPYSEMNRLDASPEEAAKIAAEWLEKLGGA
jgi:hypothetical protein